jgi:hypothetical protein
MPKNLKLAAVTVMFSIFGSFEGSFLSVVRKWAPGDVILLVLPMTLMLERIQGIFLLNMRHTTIYCKAQDVFHLICRNQSVRCRKTCMVCEFEQGTCVAYWVFCGLGTTLCKPQHFNFKL